MGKPLIGHWFDVETFKGDERPLKSDKEMLTFWPAVGEGGSIVALSSSPSSDEFVADRDVKEDSVLLDVVVD